MHALAARGADDSNVPAPITLDSITLESISLDDTLEPVPPQRDLPAVFQAAGATHPGKVRTNNEDAYAIFADIGLCAVADGLGGRRGGEVASAMAIHETRQFLARAPLGWEAAPGAALAAALAHANRAVRDAGDHDARYTGMASTFVGLLFSGNRVAVAHVGDSRAYRLRRGTAERLTVDHSMRELYLRTFGARADPRVAERNASIVTRALGGRERIQPDIRTEVVEPGDAFLLCSDGLWGLVGDEEIAFAFAGTPSLDVVLARLMTTAYDRGGTDNITAVVVRPFAEALATPPS